MAGTCQEYSFSFLPVATRQLLHISALALLEENYLTLSYKKTGTHMIGTNCFDKACSFEFNRWI